MQGSRLGAVGGLRLIARVLKRVLGLDTVGDVAADTLNLSAVFTAYRDFAPCDPTRAIATGNFLVVHARTVGLHRRRALLNDAQFNGGASQYFARFSRERAIGVVGICNKPGAIAAHDHVALRGQQTARALLRLAQLPVTVGKLLIARFEQAHGLCNCALTHQQGSRPRHNPWRTMCRCRWQCRSIHSRRPEDTRPQQSLPRMQKSPMQWKRCGPGVLPDRATMSSPIRLSIVIRVAWHQRRDGSHLAPRTLQFYS